jgi:hypothetical protein
MKLVQVPIKMEASQPVGRYDFFFPVDASQRFMFQLIGVPEPHKRWVVYDTSHNLPRQEMIAETLAWLDRYFGRIAAQ